MANVAAASGIRALRFQINRRRLAEALRPECKPGATAARPDCLCGGRLQRSRRAALSASDVTELVKERLDHPASSMSVGSTGHATPHSTQDRQLEPRTAMRHRGAPPRKPSTIMVIARSETISLRSGAVWIVDSLPYLSPRPEGQSDAWSEEAAQAGKVGTQRLRQVVSEVPPGDVVEALGLQRGALATVRRRIMLLDGRPVELTDSWYPLDVAAGTALAESGKIKGGAITLLAGLGYRVHEAREDITFRGATEEEAGQLGLAAGTPVIRLFRTCLTKDGVPFEASVMVMVAEGRHLRYRLIAGMRP